MKLAVLSGKGGTGKTTLSVNLFSVLERGSLIDTDTEEPNAHIFLKGDATSEEDVFKDFPVIDHEKCTLCGKCGDNCNFNALLPALKKVHVFDDLCHDCGMCKLVCEDDAIIYVPKSMGKIYTNNVTKHKKYSYGKLRIGEVSGVRIIDAMKEQSINEEMLIIDCPPGVSCSTVSAIKDVDFAVVCAEPTPFGLSDMKMVVELLREEEIDFGVVVNKSGLGNSDIYDYLNEENIPLLAKIPFTRERAVIYSNGELISEHDEEFKDIMSSIVQQVTKLVGEQNG